MRHERAHELRGAPARDVQIEVVGSSAEARRAIRRFDPDASALRISEDGEGLLRVVIRDDGHFDQPRPGGMGSRLLDEIAVRWERRRDASMTVLDVWLPGLVT